LLGDSNGTVLVADRDGWAYIRYNDSLDQLAIVRYLIPDQFADGTPVVVGKKHPNDPYEQVLGADWAMYAWSPATSTVTDHATPAVDLNDLSPGKVVPTDPTSLSVNVRAFLYVNGDAAVEFGGGAIDLTANVPGIAGHRLALVYVDLDTDSLAAEDGDIVAVGTDAEAPAVPENGLPLGVVDLANGETTIEAGDISQYKAMYLSVGEAIDLTQLSDYARGYIIRGGAADWEAYDANDNGAALVGDGTDINSTTTPTWSGVHTFTLGLTSNGTVTTNAGRIINTTRVTVAYTALVSDHMIYADTDGGAYTIDLPAGVEGQYLRIANVGTSGNDVTIDGDGAETVRGAATQVISDGEILILVYNATEGLW
jgi:hypothetical protein